MTTHHSRLLENIGFAVGVAVGAFYVVAVEAVPQLCYSLGKCLQAPQPHPFPWGVVIIVTALVLPKTLGRVTAGKVWQTISAKFPGGGQPPAAEG